jgi:hypothetical protein
MNFSAVVKPSMMTTQRALSFQHPILHPRSGSASAPKNRSACPLLSKPNRVSYNFQPSPRYQTLGAHSAQPITPKSFATDFLHSPSKEEDRNRRDLDCRYLQEKRLEGKRSDSDDYYYAVSEPRFNKLVRGNSEHDGDSEDGGSGVDDVADGDAGGGWSFGVDEEEEEDDDLRPGNKPVPEPSLEDLLALYKFAQSNLQPQ